MRETLRYKLPEDLYDRWMQNVFKTWVRHKIPIIFGIPLEEAKLIVEHYDNKKKATRKA